MAPGTTELALQLDPGGAIFKCIAEFGKVTTDEVEVDVVDPSRLFVPFDLTCSESRRGSVHLPRRPGSPMRARRLRTQYIRRVAHGLLPSDTVERAGYPHAPNPVVRAVRDGSVVATFHLAMREAGWTGSFVSCSGSGISIPDEPGPYPRGAFEWCPEPPFAEIRRGMEQARV